MPQIRQYPQATSLQQTDALVIDRVSQGSMYIETGSIQSGSPYMMSFEFLGGTPPTTNELMGGHVFPLAVNTSVNFAGVPVLFALAAAQGHCEVSPAATFTATLYKVSGGVSTSIGTMVIDTSGVFSFSVAAAQSFSAGDSLKIIAPVTPDTQVANLWWTIPASLP